MALVEAIGIAKKAREECRKIVTPVVEAPRGIDHQQVINSIRDCIDRLRDDVHKFQSDKISAALPDLDRFITNYARETDETNRYKIADEMYEALNDTIGSISKEIDRAV